MKHYWLVIVVILGVVLVSGSCTEVPESISIPASITPEAPTLDTTPPPPITGLIMINAYDGRVNLWWEKSTAEDFDHYNVYASESEVKDVTGLTPVHQIRDIPTTNYQATGLRDGTRYYFAITAVDKNGNENRQVSSLSIIPTPMPTGTKDPDLQVDVYQSDEVWAGTTLLPDHHNPQKPRIIEVNMLGEIVWEYSVPQKGSIDAELMPNDHILYNVGHGTGIYEIDRSGKVVWSYMTNKVDHDADRLPNGNTVFVFGFGDQKSDAQVTEVNPKGEVVWTWCAKDHLDIPPYNDIYDDPRRILKTVPGIDMIEKTDCREDALCCGAGGGKMWMSETGQQRISQVLLAQVTECKPAILATACPYCLTMLENESREAGLETSLEVMDIAEIFQRSLT